MRREKFIGNLREKFDILYKSISFEIRNDFFDIFHSGLKLCHD